MIGERKKMNKLIIASHGSLSEGLLDSAQFIIGKIENVECIQAYVNPVPALPYTLSKRVQQSNA